MKKYLLMVALSLVALLCSACQNQKNESINTKAKNDTEVQTEKEETKEETKEEKLDNAWESAYRDFIGSANYNLVDPYDLRSKTNEWFYLGIHDFNNDGIPELILGDDASVGIYTYKNKSVEKVTDLYETEDWMVINGLHYKNNSIVLESDGSDGIGYVCFTYLDGKYVTGSHDDYNPKDAILNDQKTTYDEFSKIFDITDLMDNSNISKIRIKGNGSNTTISLDDGSSDIILDDLDFKKISW
jgi:hypothetical protein